MRSSPAKFPVIVAGGGVIFSHGQDEAVALAEQLGAPVVASYLHNDSFPNRHELYCGPLGYQGSKAAMRILAAGRRRAGARHPARPVRHAAAVRHRVLAEGRPHRPGRSRPPDDRPDQEDRRRRGRRCPRGRGRAADAPAEPAARRPRQPGARLAEVRRQKAAWEEELSGMSSAEGSPIAPRRALRELEQAMPEERDGHDRHRQRLLGRQQLSALRARPTASSPR